MRSLITVIKDICKDAVSASYEMFKVMIPVIIVVKLLQELGLIAYLAWPLKPIMGLVGLPAEMGLVWATAIVNTTYAGLIVFLSLAADTPLTSAQATVLAVLILVAHALPMESSIARRSGARFLFQCVIRLAGAFSLGWLLNRIYTATGTLQEPATVLFRMDPQAQVDPSLANWAMDQGMNLLSIFGVILALLVMMRLLDILGVIRLMNSILRPILKLIGIGTKASAITVIGLTMGLSYGGGLIINEARKGNVGKEDIFYSLTLMGLCHSLIEDTLLLALIGAHFSGIFWGRLIFAIVAMAAIVQVVRRLPPRIQNTYLWVGK
jgi:spore maturation protein SpmB